MLRRLLAIIFHVSGREVHDVVIVLAHFGIGVVHENARTLLEELGLLRRKQAEQGRSSAESGCAASHFDAGLPHRVGLHIHSRRGAFP